MDTRGLRHLKAYLGEEGAKLAKAKRAVDVVPVLAARRQSAQPSSELSSATTATTHDKKTPFPLSAAVMQYLETRLASGAARRLSRTQMSLVEALAAVKTGGDDNTAATTAAAAAADAVVTVTRGKVARVDEVVDVVAVTALQLHARRAEQKAAAAAGGVPAEMSSLFVLTDDAAAVRAVTQQLEQRYGLTVLSLADADAPRHPTFPSGAAPASKKKAPKAAAKTKKAKVTSEETSETAPAASAATAVVVVASPAGFLAVDRRSAIWKFVGGVAIALHQPASQAGSLLSLLTSKVASAPTSAAATAVTPQALNAQRWACLGHVANIAVMAKEQPWLTVPALDLLTTVSIDSVDAAPDASVLSTALLPARTPVTVHYTVATGTQRFQFLYSLLKGLVQHRGIVVHVATRECAMFLYDTLYAFLDDLPPYVQLLSDYEGASAYTDMHSSADRQRLCGAFDTIVSAGKGDKTAAVLISCFGLVPRSGSVFLQYDIIPDMANYSQFIAEVLTPGAAAAAHSASAAVEVRRERTTRHRKRSVSPPPSPKPTRKATAGQSATAGRAAQGASNTADPSSPSSDDTNAVASHQAAVNYAHILLLFRPNEVKAAVARLRADGGARYHLEFRELPNKAGGRYLFIGEKLKSLNKKLFAIQNAAYHAYKSTMRVYSTVGPRDVYDETKVALEKVAEEFGYTEMPLLDLRLKDTVFRPKEDYFRAARQKQDAERRAYRKFAAENIIAEEAEEHVADAVE